MSHTFRCSVENVVAAVDDVSAVAAAGAVGRDDDDAERFRTMGVMGRVIRNLGMQMELTRKEDAATDHAPL